VTDFAEDMIRHQRLVVLIVLLRSPNRQASLGVLRVALQHSGFHPSHAEIEELVDWLQQGGLVVRKTLEGFGQKIHLAHLTQRGADVADGSATREGVRRPDLYAVPQMLEGEH